LLARPRWWRRWGLPAFALAAALAVIATLALHRRTSPAPAAPAVAQGKGLRVIPRPERLTLADGSIVELNHDSKLEPAFVSAERRVRLVRGEAHFTVAKNPARPFVVEAGAVAVRAVGTAFDVRRGDAAVEVLVTEGRVQLERPAPAAGAPAPAPTPLAAGERAIVDQSGAAPAITAVSAGDIERALAWQGVMLKFSDLPLGEVVTEFNLRNPQQLLTADAETAQVLVGGTFRADNVEAFVRLLELSFGVTAERRADGTTVLHRAR
jgi:transmembrane sensor